MTSHYVLYRTGMTCHCRVVYVYWFQYSALQGLEGQESVVIIRHSLPNRCFTRIDRRVFTNTNLSDGAKVLYGYLCGLRNGANFSDAYVIKALDTSQRVLTRRKKELKDEDLILMDQLTPRIYVIYIGHSLLSASEVKAGWNREDDLFKAKDNE